MGYGIFAQALILVFGIWWCAHVIGRWREDVDIVMTSESMVPRIVTVGYWLVTVLIGLWVISTICGIVVAAVDFFRGW